jgi:hypothetical protein
MTEQPTVLVGSSMIDGRKVIDELCTCGGLQSMHGGDRGHGPCEWTDCLQFTWGGWAFEGDKLAESIHMYQAVLSSIKSEFQCKLLDLSGLVDEVDAQAGDSTFEACLDAVDNLRTELEYQRDTAIDSISDLRSAHDDDFVNELFSKWSSMKGKNNGN